MTLNEYQKEAFKFNQVPEGSQQAHSIHGLVEEVGELSGKIKRYYRGDYSDSLDWIKAMEKEIGDVLWYVADFCTTHNFELEDIALGNLEKLRARAAAGTIKGKGDNR